MSEHLNQLDSRLLRDEELDTVVGGTEGYPGIPLGTNLNTSIWSRPLDFGWVLVGATGHLPR
jgi:hypothetical protein